MPGSPTQKTMLERLLRGEPHCRRRRHSVNNLNGALAATSLAGSTPTLLPLPATSAPSTATASTDSVNTFHDAVEAIPAAEEEDEVEALADSVAVTAAGERRSSLTPSEEALVLPGRRTGSTQTPRRSSIDAPSVVSATSGRSGRSGGHSYATAKNYFPLVQKRSVSETVTKQEQSAVAPAASPTAGQPFLAAASGTRTPQPHDHARRRPSGASQTSSSARPVSVFPTIKPSRSAGSSVFPLRTPSGTASKVPSPPHSDSASVHSGPTPVVPSPPASTFRSPPATRTASSSRPFSSVGSSYAPSIAPSNRSGETTGSSRRVSKPFVKPSYAASQAPSHAEAYYAAAAEPLEGPTSIFFNPTPQQRSMKELLPHPKKRLSSFFGRSKHKVASPTPGDAPPGMSYRGKSASILDAALTTSATWAAHRGEQSRMPAHSSAPFIGAGAFGAPQGYRPAHQIRRQQEEAAARLAAGTGATMGGGGEEPVSSAAIAEAFTRNQGRAAGGLVRSGSMISMASVADIASPVGVANGGGAFPVRQETGATRSRPRASGPASASGGSGGSMRGATAQAGLGIE